MPLPGMILMGLVARLCPFVGSTKTAKEDAMNLFRRKFLQLASGAAAASGVVAGSALAQHAIGARAKGPLVWLDMDQKELDDAYDQRVYAPNMQQVVTRLQRVGDNVRERLGAPKRLAYGSTPIEALDLYAAKVSNAPINIFVHGGAWRAGSAKNSSHHAEMIVNAGAHLVVLDFNNVIEASGNLITMADQVRRGVAWVYENAKSFSGDPEQIYISGHSSGGHLVGVLLTTDWWKDFNLPPTLIKGGVAASGMFDLKPVRLSARSSYVKFTDEMEQHLSPQRHLDKLVAPVAVVYGSAETPEFQRQSRDFAKAVNVAGKSATLSVMEGYNHFEVWEQLANPYSVFGRVVLEQMKLA
jgi:arylformamidase